MNHPKTKGIVTFYSQDNKIIVYPDCFVWKLNIFDDELRLQVSGRKGNSSATLIESPTLDNGSTGSSGRLITEIKTG